ncbi:MAG: TonB-dependent receptor, partial [bacterium]|nr:TonB-dependent receptor [bacterium]
TTTRNHQTRFTWSRSWNSATTTDFSAGFDRIGSLLVPEETSLGTYYVFSRDLDSLGPRSNIPIDRSQNMFRYGGLLRHIRGNHALTFGFDLTRRQVNGFESNRHRGMFSFRRDFGRDTVENLQMGTPSSYTLGLGNVHRGFRNWVMGFFVGDDWRLTSALTLNVGLRYEPITSPYEVNGLSKIPYSSDNNNVAPRFGLAYRLPGAWGALRAAYGLHYGEIFPATFLQARFNPPGNISVRVQVPDLADPFKDFDSSDLDPDARSSIIQFAPDLSTPYSHQYNFSWEFTVAGDWALQLGYVGSRSHRLLAAWSLNRARVAPGIPQTTKTVNQRRPDQRYFEVRHVHNGSRGYFDAAKVTLRLPSRKGFTIDASYWFSKAIDLGSDYTGTAAGRDAYETAGPSEFDHQ